MAQKLRARVVREGMGTRRGRVAGPVVLSCTRERREERAKALTIEFRAVQFTRCKKMESSYVMHNFFIHHLNEKHAEYHWPTLPRSKVIAIAARWG